MTIPMPKKEYISIQKYQALYQENIHKRDCGFFDESYDACGDYNG